MVSKNLGYYLATISIFILMKLGFVLASNKDVLFLLKPTNKLVGLLLGSHSVYQKDIGYYHSMLNISIDKSCSGFNFWCLSFLAFTHLLLKLSNQKTHKILSVVLALLVTYLLTIFVNTSRIYVSIIIQSQTKELFLNQQGIIHESIGIVTNLTFLILFYILIEKFTIKPHSYEKLT